MVRFLFLPIIAILLFLVSCNNDFQYLQRGKIGDLTWTLCKNGVLTVSGIGTIPDYRVTPTEILPPWFENRNYIKTVDIGNSVTQIGNLAFFRCDSLTDVSIGNSVSRIGYRSFLACISLTSLVIPNSVTEIDSASFAGCKGLLTLTIPSSVSVIRSGAFYDCVSLEEIINHRETPVPIIRTVFSNVSKSCLLYVPANSIDAYRFAITWREFENILPIE